MTRLRLREDVFMARADGLLIFLDLKADRYFALAAELSAQLAPLIEVGGAEPDLDVVRRLRKAGAAADDGDEGARDFFITRHRQANEGVPNSGTTPALALGAAFCRLRASELLKRRHLSEVTRDRRLARVRNRTRAAADENVRSVSSKFVAARALRGGRDACLKEALALLLFLGAEGSRADWVFGVKGAPFAAHCWVQLGETVLNDSVDNVRAYTPIMVV